MSDLSPLMTEVLQNGRRSHPHHHRNHYASPAARRDKVCLIKPEHLKKYDLPRFVRPDGGHILHRIVEVTQSGFVVIGDNQWVKEYPVLPSQVIGVVKGPWRNGEYISCEDFR